MLNMESTKPLEKVYNGIDESITASTTSIYSDSSKDGLSCIFFLFHLSSMYAFNVILNVQLFSTMEELFCVK